LFAFNFSSSPLESCRVFSDPGRAGDELMLQVCDATLMCKLLGQPHGGGPVARLGALSKLIDAAFRVADRPGRWPSRA
jgi:hypothetical protein